MGRLTSNTKHLIFEMQINADRNTLQLIETIAKTLKIASSERRDYEYLQLMHVRTINTQEATNAKRI